MTKVVSLGSGTLPVRGADLSNVLSHAWDPHPQGKPS
jgi:hypothetical protein